MSEEGKKLCPVCDVPLALRSKVAKGIELGGYLCPACNEFYSKAAIDPEEFAPIHFHKFLSEAMHQKMILYCDFGDESHVDIHAITAAEDFDAESGVDFTWYYLFQANLENFTQYGGFTPVNEVRLTPKLVKALRETMP